MKEIEYMDLSLGKMFSVMSGRECEEWNDEIKGEKEKARKECCYWARCN